METHMIVRLVLGLLITAVALAVAGRRVFFLYRMIAAGQPSPGRLDEASAPDVPDYPYGGPGQDQRSRRLGGGR